MGKISTYITDSNVTLADKVIGTDAENSNETKNYLLSDVYNLFSAQSVPQDFGSPIFQPNIIEYSSSTCGAISLDLYVNGYSYNVFGSSEIQAPNLVTMYGGIVLIGDYANGSYANFHSFLQLIDMPLLESVGQLLIEDQYSIDIEGWGELTEIDLGSLSYVQGGTIYIVDNPNLTTLNLNSLETITSGNLFIYNNPSLESLDLTNLTSFDGNVQMSNNGLDQTSIDGILNQLANVVILSNRGVDLSLGTNASPSATGLANAAILTANGCAVAYN
jgi:hypothetical protein